jgi:surface protein
MNSMFSGCKSLKTININIFKENKVTNLSYAFSSCESIIEIDLSFF